MGQLLTSGGIYRPTGLLEKLAPVLADPAAGVIGLHLYTFNQVEFDRGVAAGAPRDAVSGGGEHGAADRFVTGGASRPSQWPHDT